MYYIRKLKWPFKRSIRRYLGKAVAVDIIHASAASSVVPDGRRLLAYQTFKSKYAIRATIYTVH